jgi:hypothetical protein
MEHPVAKAYALFDGKENVRQAHLRAYAEKNGLVGKQIDNYVNWISKADPIRLNKDDVLKVQV